MLLERTDVDPNKQDHRGRTPFLCAYLRGHADVVALLRPLLADPRMDDPSAILARLRKLHEHLFLRPLIPAQHQPALCNVLF